MYNDLCAQAHLIELCAQAHVLKRIMLLAHMQVSDLGLAQVLPEGTRTQVSPVHCKVDLQAQTAPSQSSHHAI